MREPQRPAAGEYNAYYEGYIARVPDGDLRVLLAQQLAETVALLRPLSDADAAFRYAAGKWSIKQVVGHLADTERILSYRALRFARGDQTPLPGFDENVYVAGANFDERTLDSLLRELQTVRAATVALFDSLPEEGWDRSGPANDNAVTVRALACIIAGHELHHREILRNRYVGGLRATASRSG